MSKHPLDHSHDPSAARMARFIALERANRPSEAAKALQQRAREWDDTRLAKFTRIERGVQH